MSDALKTTKAFTIQYGNQRNSRILGLQAGSQSLNIQRFQEKRQ
jgi:hypothetical protein